MGWIINKVGGTGKWAVSLFVGRAEKGYAVLQHSPSGSKQANGKTTDEESRKSEECRSRNGPLLKDGSRRREDTSEDGGSYRDSAGRRAG